MEIERQKDLPVITCGKTDKIFILISLLIAFIDGAFVFINYLSGKESLQNNFIQVGEKIKASYQQAILSTELRMLQIATFVAADPEIQQIFLAGKKAVENEGGGPGSSQSAHERAKLLKIIQPSRDALSNNFDFRQLHFHLGPGSLSFLRAHRPDKFGDRMDNVRHTVVAVNDKTLPVSGFETGRVYSGIRGVVPVYALHESPEINSYVGALEAGTSFNVTLNKIADLQKIEMAVLLTSDHLRENVWPDFLEKLTKNNPPVSGYYVEAATDPVISRLLTMNHFNQTNLLEDKLSTATLDHENYSVMSFPLRDFLGSLKPDRPSVGIVVARRNVQQEIDTFLLNQKINIFYGILGFIVVEILLFFGLKASTKKLNQLIERANLEIKVREDLLKEAQSIGKLGHWEFIFETNEIEWSEEIFRIFPESVTTIGEK